MHTVDHGGIDCAAEARSRQTGQASPGADGRVLVEGVAHTTMFYGMSLVPWAYELSRQSLASTLPRRWAHVQGVAAKARTLAPITEDDAALLEAAAILHDVGYAPDLHQTGFHPLDGAYFLRSVNAPDRLTNLIANHSCAIREAKLRGLQDAMSQFPDERGPIRDALWMCDLTTTPDGKPTTFDARVAEIKHRYGPDDLVTTFIESAAEDLGAAIARTTERLRVADAYPM